MNRRSRLVAGLATAGVLALSGCAGAGPQPGVAVTVDGQVVSDSQVDAGARGLCDFFSEEVEEQGAIAFLGVRQNVAVLLALRSAATQLADEVGAEPGADYERQLSDLERDTADVTPAADREALVSALSSEPYLLAIVPAIGEAQLTADGETDPGLSESSRRGLEELTTLLSEGGIEFEPGLALTYRGDVELPPADADVSPEQVLGSLFDTEDSSTSFGSSETAAQASEPGPEYAASLPQNQRCGG